MALVLETISGAAGGDSLIYGTENYGPYDNIGDDYIVNVYGDLGDDTITGAGATGGTSQYQIVRSVIYGDLDQISSSTGSAGNDSIVGGTYVGTFIQQLYPDVWNYGNFLYGDAYQIFNSSPDSGLVSGGNDTIRGGDRSTYEYIYGDSYEIWGVSSVSLPKVFGGNDVLYGSNFTGYSNVYGDAATATDVVLLGNDSIVGGTGNTRQILVGDAYTMGGSRFQGGNNPIKVTGGSDSIWGGYGAAGAGNIQLVGDAYDMLKGSVGGADNLYSGGSWLPDSAYSTAYDGYITYLIGDCYDASGYTAGSDNLWSGFSDDVMYGDNVQGSSAGATDNFYFTSISYNGNDQIVDFDYARNAKALQDRLTFTGAFANLNWDQLKTAIDVGAAPNSDTLFDFSKLSEFGYTGTRGSSLYIYGLSSSKLLAGGKPNFITIGGPSSAPPPPV